MNHSQYTNYFSTSVAAAAGYDFNRDIENKRNVYAAHILPLIPGNAERLCIVDVACGYGAYSHFLAQDGHQVFGVDLSAEQIERANQVFGGLKLHVGDAVAYLQELPSDSADLILFMDILEHLELDIAVQMLREAKRVVKPGGRLVAMSPNSLCPLNPTYTGDVTHTRAYSPKSLRQLFLLAGFETLTIEAQSIVPVSLLGRVRKLFWHAFVRPLLLSISMALHGTTQGGVFTQNLVAVVNK